MKNTQPEPSSVQDKYQTQNLPMDSKAKESNELFTTIIITFLKNGAKTQTAAKLYSQLA